MEKFQNNYVKHNINFLPCVYCKSNVYLNQRNKVDLQENIESNLLKEQPEGKQRMRKANAELEAGPSHTISFEKHMILSYMLPLLFVT